jgi:acyl-CoA dehydrogenase
MERTLFKEEHDIFRAAFRKFMEKEVIPRHEQWEEEGMVPKELWKKAGEQGFLCPWLPEQFGASGADYLYSVVITEEVARAGASGWAISLHNDICVPYLWSYGSEEQKSRWLPGCVTGELITAVAMTEPQAGSDLQAIRATAVKDGDQYVINGQKTFITNGICNDLCIVAVRTDTKVEKPAKGMSLFVVEAGTKGYVKGRKLKKIGMHAQDTAELSFEDCRVPANNLLGQEGQGFIYLMQKLQPERLVCAIAAQAGAKRVLDLTIQYCHERECFGRQIAKFQNTRFKLVEAMTKIEVSQAFVDRLILEHAAGKDVTTETCMAKYWCTEMLNDVVDECLQFYGGYGYMMEYPIAKAYIDARVQTIFAGTTEIMKEVIGRRAGI